MPLDFIKNSIKKLDKEKTHYVHCRTGYHSMVFLSILKSMGFENLIDIKGGIIALKKTKKFNISEYKAPITHSNSLKGYWCLLNTKKYMLTICV
jgi:hypothetical protein